MKDLPSIRTHVLGAGAAVLAIVLVGLTRHAAAPTRPTVSAATAALAAGSEALRLQQARHAPGGLSLAIPLDPDEQALAPRARRRQSNAPYEFYFTRAAYSSYGMRGFASWSVDFPKADRQFLIGLRRLVNHLDAYEYENPVLLTDPELHRYPFLYAVEVGYMSLSEAEVLALRRYLQAGGFLVIDDFWGSYEWQNLVSELDRILPGHSIVDLSPDHSIFHCFYDVQEIVQVPNVGNGREGLRTWEQDGFVPAVRGIFDEDERLMVVINWNSDLGDAWEWAEDPFYPLRFSTYAYQMGVNFIVYAMSH